MSISIAVMLSACGSGSDGDHNSTPASPESNSSESNSPAFTLTAFDGYLENAVVFIDKDDSTTFNTGDEFLGLTNAKGQLSLESVPQKALSLQTLVLGQSAQLYLASLDSKYTNRYTVDADRPAQPLTGEYVIQTVAGADVVSPITDLVALEIKNGADQATAITRVQQALGLNTNDDIFVDYVEGATANVKLHKTAQLLADSKVNASTKYAQNPIDFAKDAKQRVDAMSSDELKDPNFRAPVNGDVGDVDEIVFETYVDPIVAASVQEKFNSLSLVYGQKAGNSMFFFNADISKLFRDQDVQNKDLVDLLRVKNTASNYSIVDKYGNKTGLIAYITGGTLNVGMKSTEMLSRVGKFHVEIEYSAELEGTNSHLAVFEFEIKPSDDMPPQVNSATHQALQTKIYEWNLYQGVSVNDGYTVDIAGLFEGHGQNFELALNPDNDTNGLVITLDKGIVTVTGTPSKTADKGVYNFSIIATAENSKSEEVIIYLPEVKAAPANNGS
ncbi:hypothetical protein VV869_05695 [Photobacterium sp. MCCC 1A19761]|uniref:hypothetical protein n=1 Tax=Photobacterium sp. MCCC 1A19761 TaxID=3115000 RepID=UPI00307FBD30